MLALRTTASDALKHDINDATSFLEDYVIVLHMCGFVLWKSALLTDIMLLQMFCRSASLCRGSVCSVLIVVFPDHIYFLCSSLGL